MSGYLSHRGRLNVTLEERGRPRGRLALRGTSPCRHRAELNSLAIEARCVGRWLDASNVGGRDYPYLLGRDGKLDLRGSTRRRAGGLLGQC
jgi:hypothetical protein